MTLSYNVQHSPNGAFASFTFGHFRTPGGMAQELGRPGSQNVYLGTRPVGERTASVFPFIENGKDARASFEVGAASSTDSALVRVIDETELSRRLEPARDLWQFGPLRVSVISPRRKLPDPQVASLDECREVYCPAVYVELSLDNLAGEGGIDGFFALEDAAWLALQDPSVSGFSRGGRLGMAWEPSPAVAPFLEFSLGEGLDQAGSRLFGLGRVAGVRLRANADARVSVVVALGFWHEGNATTGKRSVYAFQRWFSGLEDVLVSALGAYQSHVNHADELARELLSQALNDQQRFLYCQAVHSYFGSTSLLWLDDGPLWVVAEGEYVMMNTLDLTIDHAFFELRWGPWMQRTVLEFFAKNYAYTDQLIDHDDTNNLLPGGISFCHDHGVANQFSPSGHSAYELAGLDGTCFSFMSYEELLNYVLALALYVHETGAHDFAQRNSELIAKCSTSLLNRDHPEPALRRGVMGFDGARCGGGREITTYDSLDSSLGPARGNLYIAVKTWAAHVALSLLFRALEQGGASDAALLMADRSMATILAAFSAELGYLPASLDGVTKSAILPAIEPLVYVAELGLSALLAPTGRYGALVSLLRRHFEAVFRPGLCQFDDGGWKLSSTSGNSWLSKIALAQQVARTILKVEFTPEQALRHDRAHADWLRAGGGYWAASDQFLSGLAHGSRYYPRLVTTCLWLARA